MTDRQHAITRLARSMGYHALPRHAVAIDVLAADMIRDAHGQLLAHLAENPSSDPDARRRIDDELNPTLRRAVRIVMEDAIAEAVSAAPRHND